MKDVFSKQSVLYPRRASLTIALTLENTDDEQAFDEVAAMIRERLPHAELDIRLYTSSERAYGLPRV